MKITPIQYATFLAGGQAALARVLNICPQAVQKWCRAGIVPAKRVLEVERAINNKITRYELRPDLFGPADTNKPA